MDGRTFDDMAKALVAGASRRRALAGFAGAALGAIGLSGGRAAQTDATGQFCGGIAPVVCPDGYECVDDPTDDCDPAAGPAA